MSNDFKPMSQVIANDMDEAKRRMLVQKVSQIVNALDASDAVQLLILVQGSVAIKSKITQEVTTFALNQEMNSSTDFAAFISLDEFILSSISQQASDKVCRPYFLQMNLCVEQK